MSSDQRLLALGTLAATFVASLALVPLVRWLAHRLGVLDAPGPRKIHSAPMPRLGGVAVFGAFTLVVGLGYLLLPMFAGSPLRQTFADALDLLGAAASVEHKLVAFLAGSSLVFGVGLLDDLLGTRFPIWVKVVGQVLAALVLIAADVRTSFLPTVFLNQALTLLWLVGITNAFNLLDNMDGLSAGVAAVAAGVLLINAWRLGEFFIVLVLAALIGSALGFLVFNFHPASIFLGDCGSLFLGYALGGLTLLERYVSTASSTLFPVLMPVLILAIPILDTFTVVVIRLREHRPIYVGDTRHLSHRLVSLGFSTRTTVLFIYLATFTLGLGAALLPHANPSQTLMIVAQGGGFVALLATLLFFDRRRNPR